MQMQYIYEMRLVIKSSARITSDDVGSGPILPDSKSGDSASVERLRGRIILYLRYWFLPGGVFHRPVTSGSRVYHVCSKTYSKR
jgi:hypothetical protein